MVFSQNRKRDERRCQEKEKKMATIELVRESKSHEEGMVPLRPTPPQSFILTFLPLGRFLVNHVTTLDPPFPFLRLPSP